jgi:hypothetical protein
MRNFALSLVAAAVAALAAFGESPKAPSPGDAVEYEALPEALRRRRAELEAEVATLSQKIAAGRMTPTDLDGTAEAVARAGEAALAELLLHRERVDWYLREIRHADGFYRALSAQFEGRLKDYVDVPGLSTEVQPRTIVGDSKSEIDRAVRNLSDAYARVTRFRVGLDAVIDQTRTAVMASRDIAIAHKVRTGIAKEDPRKGGQDALSVLTHALSGFLNATKALSQPSPEESEKKFEEKSAEARALALAFQAREAEIELLRRDLSKATALSQVRSPAPNRVTYPSPPDRPVRTANLRPLPQPPAAPARYGYYIGERWVEAAPPPPTAVYFTLAPPSPKGGCREE